MPDIITEEIVEIAARAARADDPVVFGLLSDDEISQTMRAALSAVAERIVKGEREACAKIAADYAKGWRAYRDHYPQADAAETIVAALRARGVSGEKANG